LEFRGDHAQANQALSVRKNHIHIYIHKGQMLQLYIVAQSSV
jgi:hypothetical protein